MFPKFVLLIWKDWGFSTEASDFHLCSELFIVCWLAHVAFLQFLSFFILYVLFYFLTSTVDPYCLLVTELHNCYASKWAPPREAFSRAAHAIPGTSEHHVVGHIHIYQSPTSPLIDGALVAPHRCPHSRLVWDIHIRPTQIFNLACAQMA